MNLKKLFKYWLPVVLWMGVIFTFSSFPTKKAGGVYWLDFIIKKTAHLIEYGFLTILNYRALKAYGVNNKKAAIIAITFSLLYGATDEFHQSFTPGREPRIRDVFIDTIGAGLVIYGIWNWIDKFPFIKKIAKKYEVIN